MKRLLDASSRSATLAPVLISLVVAALPWISGAGPTLLRQISLAAIYALVVVGFNLSYGFGGQLALGQVAVFAAGAYTGAILSEHGVKELSIAFVIATIAAAILGAITGIPGLRLKAWALAISAFFLVLLVPDVAAIFPSQTKATAGITGILKPTVFGIRLSQNGFYATCVVCAVVGLVLYRNLVVSRYGVALRVLAEGDTLTRSLGLSPYRIRISSYILGSLPAGAAGVLFAYQSAYVFPGAFSFDLSTFVLAAAVVGGIRSIWGAPVAALILVIGPQDIGTFRQYSVMLYGVFLILAGIGFSGGIGGLFEVIRRRLRMGRRMSPRASAIQTSVAKAESAAITIAGEVLRIANVSKAFGEVHALRDVSLEVRPAAITAIIGANGAGKTTLINAISGLIPPDSGTITLGDRVVTAITASKIARYGVSRTFQTPRVPESLSVSEVAASGRLMRNRVGAMSIMLRSPRYRRLRAEDNAVALEALSFADLAGRASDPAHDLPLGRRRLLEVARCIAAFPAVILLDEPAAGLDSEGLAELRTLLIRLRDAGATILLVEHNVGFVMDIADNVVAMDLGAVIADGPPSAVRVDDRVIASYLGRRAHIPYGDSEVAL